MPHLRSILPRLGSSASMRAEAEAARSNVLATLQMLRNMGYRDVWVKSNEVSGQVISDAREQGWNIAEVEGNRVKFTLKWSDPEGTNRAFARTPSEAEAGPSSRPISPAPPRSSMGSYHTVGAASATRSGSVSSQSTGHTRTDSSSSVPASPHVAPLYRRRGQHHRRGSGRMNPVMGGLHFDGPNSPPTVAMPLRSPGAVSPSSHLSERAFSPLQTPELRLTTPEGVQSPPARPESDLIPHDYFSYSPGGTTLTVVTEVTENSDSSRHASLAEPQPGQFDDMDEAVVQATRPLLIQRARSSEGLTYEDLEDLVPTLDSIQTRQDMMALGSPRNIRVSLESLYSQEDENFEFDPPRRRPDVPESATSLPSPQLVATMVRRSSDQSLRGMDTKPTNPRRPSYTRDSSSDEAEPEPRTGRFMSEATIRAKNSPPFGRGSV